MKKNNFFNGEFVIVVAIEIAKVIIKHVEKQIGKGLRWYVFCDKEDNNLYLFLLKYGWT